MTSSPSEEDVGFLAARYGVDKRNNGMCPGKILCVDNLGRHYNEERLRYQLTQLLEDADDIRFAVVNVSNRRIQLGWCCIQFRSLSAAIAALKVLDHTYIKTVLSPKISRPLLAHFPDWIEKERCQSPQQGTDPMALHLGQSNTVDKESREFIYLDEILHHTKLQVIETTKRSLIDFLRLQIRREQNPHGRSNQTRSVLTNVIWLKNVPDNASNKMLQAFFECSDPQVKIQRVEDPVTQQYSSHAIAAFSTTEKAALVCQDIQTHMLLADGLRPISASLLDVDTYSGFESVLDHALMEVGSGMRASGASSELVLQENMQDDEKIIALQVRSILENMQHSRSAYKKLKREQQRALYDHLRSTVEEIHGRFVTLDNLVLEAEQLQKKVILCHENSLFLYSYLTILLL